jgi:endonuclease/exonuclease/phosphatase family metal-dependent hydrolase
MKLNYTPFILLFLISPFASALTVMEINTEFMWDHRLPHEGRIVGQKKPAPTKAQYAEKLRYFASLIKHEKADIVGLVEIEGCHVADDFLRVLNKGSQIWSSACKKGRDSFTGQDVAILSKFRISQETLSTFPNIRIPLQDKKVRPSKVLGVVVTPKSSQQKFVVIVTHLISKRGDNDAKRQAQAMAITEARNAMQSHHKTQHAIVLGDINDVVGSATLSTLVGGHYPLVNPADKNDCSYIYRNRCQLIDHILISPSLSGGSLYHIDMKEKYSDHHALIYKK